MDLAGTIGRLRARFVLVIAAAVIAVAVALTTIYSVNSSGLTKKGEVFGVGNAQILVDSSPSSLTAVNAANSAQTLASRAPLYAEYATGARTVALIAQYARLSPSSLTVAAQTTQAGSAPGAGAAPSSQTGRFGGANSVVLSADGTTPVVSISTQALSATTAGNLARAAEQALRSSLGQLQRAQRVGTLGRIVLRPLGNVNDALVVGSPSKSKAIGYAIGVFIVLLLLILLLDNWLTGRSRRRARSEIASPQH